MGGGAQFDLALSPAIRRHLGRAVLGGVILAALALARDGRAGTYRWVDEQGRVQYSGAPPSHGVAYDELDHQGRRVRQVPATIQGTEAKARRAEELRARAEQARADKAQQRRDEALLATYTNEAEVDRARDRQLEQERLLLEGLATMHRLSQSAAEKTRLDALMEARRQRVEDVRARFEADKERLRLLRGTR